MNRYSTFIAKSIASLFGVGYFWPFPATWGSAAVGIVLYFFWPGIPVEIKLVITVMMFILGVYLASLIERAENIHDPSFVVIDEAVGMMIATFLLSQFWWQWVLAFFLFRFFDILKPWPASWFDARRGGLNLMTDDVVAACYTFIILFVLLTW